MLLHVSFLMLFQTAHAQIVQDAKGFQELLTLRATGLVNSVLFSPDGKRIAAGSWDAIRVWDVANGQEVFTLKAHFMHVDSVAWSENGKTIVAAGSELLNGNVPSGKGKIMVWDATTGKEILCIFGSGRFPCVAFSPDGNSIVSSDFDDRTLAIRNIASGQITRVLLALPDDRLAVGTWHVAYSPNGKRIISCTSNDTTNEVNKVMMWDIESGKVWLPIGGQQEKTKISPRRVAFSPDGRKIVGCGSSHSNGSKPWLQVWDAETGNDIVTFNGHQARVLSAVFSPGSEKIISGGQDASMRVWDAVTGKELATLWGHRVPVVNTLGAKQLASVSAVAISPDGTKIASGSVDKTVKVWAVPKGFVDPPMPKPAPSLEPKPAAPPQNLKVLAQKKWDIQANDPADKQRPGSHCKIAPATLIAGKIYVLEMKSLPGSAVEPHLRLQDGIGNLLAQSENDGKVARLTYSSPHDLKCFLVTTTAGTNQFGAFELVISEVVAQPAANLDR